MAAVGWVKRPSPGWGASRRFTQIVLEVKLTSAVATKTTLSSTNLQALGAERLAELLIEISSGNPAAKRRLRLELAGAQSPKELAKEVRKRLTTIARSRSFVDWQGVRALAGDLDTQRRAIVDNVAKADPKQDIDLLWQFMGLASCVFERCDDSNGVVIGIFHQACSDLGDLAAKAKADPVKLADLAFEALIGNDYGEFDQLIRVLSPRAGAHARGPCRGAGRTAKPLRAPGGAEVGIDATRRLVPVIGRLRAGMVPTT